MKKLTINCNFGGVSSPFSFYIGNPENTHHPVQFQAEWLSKVRGGSVPGDVMESLQKLYDLSRKNNLSFEELCEYALASADEEEGGKAAE
jgi:hypothetical protein